MTTIAKSSPRAPLMPRVGLAPMATFGVGGAVVYGGYLRSNEKDASLGATERYRTFSEFLANVSTVALGVRHFLNLGAKCDWAFQPANDSAEAKKAAEFATAVFADMKEPWFRTVRRMLMHRFYGFSIHEWTAKRRKDGKLGFLEVAARPQSTIEQWDLDIQGRVLGLIQRSPQTAESIYIPRAKMLYLVEDALADSPEGFGIFRHLVEPVKRLQRYEMLEGFAFETDLRGIPVGRAPLSEMASQIASSNLDEAKRDALLKPMKDFISGHIRTPALGLLLDSITYQTVDEHASPSNVPLWDMQVMKGTSTALPDMYKAIERQMVTIARLLGIEHLLMGADGKGSLALSADKTGNFALLVDSSLKEAKESTREDLLKPLMRLNGIDEELTPAIEIETVQARSIADITGALRDMAQAGAMLAPDDPVMDEVRRLLGLRSKTKTLDLSLVPDPNPKQAPGASARPTPSENK